MLFFYIRHGDPIYDPDSLTDLGKRQAEAVAKRLALHGIDKIYSSTSSRAIQTAKPTSEILKKEINLIDFANEGHAWNEFAIETSSGKKWIQNISSMKELFHTEEMMNLGFNWYNHKDLLDYNFKRGIDRVNEESANFFLNLGYKKVGKGKYQIINNNQDRVALFAHQGFGMVFLADLLGVPYPIMCTHFTMNHTGVTVIEFKEVNGYAYPKVLTLSNDSHFIIDGLPTKYENRILF